LPLVRGGSPRAWALDAAAIEVARFGAAEGWSCAQLVAALEAVRDDGVSSSVYPH
jgi:hypothetical protein